MKKPFVMTKRVLIALSLVFIGGGIILGALAYIFIHQPPNFKGYKSSMQLNGSPLQNSVLYYTDTEHTIKEGVGYKQTYESGVILYESKSIGWRPTCEGFKDDSDSADTYECKEGDIKFGGKYKVQIIRHGDAVKNVIAFATMRDTGITVIIPESKREELAKYDGWQQFFDAMKPVNLLFLPYKYEPPFPDA